jgi:hypothetical protein
VNQDEWVKAAWAASKPFIERAVKRADGCFDIDHVWAEIEAGKAQLWPGVHGAIVTRIEVHPSGKKVVLFWLAGGDDLKEMASQEQAIEKWAKGMGCTGSEIIGRRGWLKALPGYREASTLLTKDFAP